jgi:iron complex transport system substrate-binding protein
MRWIQTLIISLLISPSSFACLEKFVDIKLPYQSKKFSLSKYNNHYQLNLSGQKFVIGNEDLVGCKGVTQLRPLSKVVTLSSSNLAFIEALGLLDRVVGAQDINLAYSVEVKKRKIEEIGRPASLDKVIVLSPDAVITYTNGDNNIASLKQRKGISTIVFEIDDYLEIDPLERASWILVYGAILGAYEKAESQFVDISKKYNELKALKNKNQTRPRVIVGSFFQGIWYAPAKTSYFSNLIYDAGGVYFLEKESSGTVSLTSEDVVGEFKNMSLWLPHDLSMSMDELKIKSELYPLMLKDKKIDVYNFVKRINENKGIDFWESGIVRPDIVLSDFILMIKNKEKYEGELFWYKKL